MEIKTIQLLFFLCFKIQNFALKNNDFFKGQYSVKLFFKLPIVELLPAPARTPANNQKFCCYIVCTFDFKKPSKQDQNNISGD